MDYQIGGYLFLLYEVYSFCFKLMIKPLGLHLERWIIARSILFSKGYFVLEMILFTIIETILVMKVSKYIHHKVKHTVWAIFLVAFLYAGFYAVLVHPLYGVFMYPYAILLMYIHEHYQPKHMSMFQLFLYIHALLNLLPTAYACLFM